MLGPAPPIQRRHIEVLAGMATAAEQQPVADLEAKLGGVRPVLDVVGMQPVLPRAALAAPLTGVVVPSIDRRSPLTVRGTVSAGAVSGLALLPCTSALQRARSAWLPLALPTGREVERRRADHADPRLTERRDSATDDVRALDGTARVPGLAGHEDAQRLPACGAGDRHPRRRSETAGDVGVEPKTPAASRAESAKQVRVGLERGTALLTGAAGAPSPLLRGRSGILVGHLDNPQVSRPRAAPTVAGVSRASILPDWGTRR